MRRKEISNKYLTVAKLIAAHQTKIIGLCTDNKNYYMHKREEIYDFINPMSSYKEACYLDDMLCIIV